MIIFPDKNKITTSMKLSTKEISNHVSLYLKKFPSTLNDFMIKYNLKDSQNY